MTSCNWKKNQMTVKKIVFLRIGNMHFKYFHLLFFLFICLFKQTDFYPEKMYERKLIEGIVHPKMKILSLITHPHVVPN